MKFFFLLQTVFFVLALFRSPFLPGEDFNRQNDFQFWFYDSIKKNINEQLKLHYENEFRWGKGASIFYLFYFQQGFRYSFRPWLEMGPAYRQIFSLQQADRKWITTYAPLVDIIFHYPAER